MCVVFFFFFEYLFSLPTCLLIDYYLLPLGIFVDQDCMIAFVFVNEDEASAIHKKVINRSKHISKSSTKIKTVEPSAAPSPVLAPNGKKKGGIDKSMISAPTDFKRVAHMGYDSNAGFTTENVDPSWAQLLTNLTDMGFSKSDYMSFYTRTRYPIVNPLSKITLPRQVVSSKF
ncbi:hypothetical protein VP01_1292g6 [Puccinia sorghi]|uniref:CRIB domain-containing protein n=1 Tax=Puccinia sorghi TaxID=27349 RepID=A0A0L6VQ25_9BASI|nr:hypothetical protein VP01_1292g6 [Puccinia sorghi]